MIRGEIKTRKIEPVGKPQEYEIKPLPESITKRWKLRYEKVGFLELAWFRAGQAFDSIHVYSKITLSIILLALKLESIFQSLGGKMSLFELLTQRRIWVAIIGTLGVILGALGVELPDVFITDSPEAIASIIAGILAIWSFFKPKP